MSVHSTFNNAQPAPLPVAIPPCVLRFAGLKPRQLALFKMHDGRSGGDLAHVDLSITSFNRVEQGAANWIAKLKRQIKVISARNLKQEVSALRVKNCPKKALERLQSGLQMPCHKSTGSPLREGIITVHKNWFGGTGRDKWDEDKVDLFRRYAMSFLYKNFPKGQLQYAASHSDEEAFHIHFVVAVWDVKTSKNRGQQIQLRPGANPILRSYELAQDLVGEHMKEIGITRGERRAEARRLAIAAGEKVPKKRRHVPPSEFREDERRKGREDAQVIRDAAVEDCEMARNKTKSRASRVVRATRRKTRKAEKRRVAVQTETARLASKQGGLTAACADAERKLEKTQEAASIMMENALELSTKTVRKSRKRAIKDAKARKLAADKLVQEAAQKCASDVEAATQAERKAAAANHMRRNDEAAAETAQLRTASARQKEADTHASAANYIEMANEAKSHLEVVDAARIAARSETSEAIAERDAARVDETVARAGAAAALETRDARLAEIADAAVAQKQIDDARQRDLAVASSVNEAAAQKVTARETAIDASEHGMTSLCGALSAGEITIGNDGRLRMTDSQYVKAMPSKLRVVLVPIIKTIIELKLRLTERLAVVENSIRKIDDFLKRDDLTAEARMEAEVLRTPNWSDSVDEPS